MSFVVRMSVWLDGKSIRPAVERHTGFIEEAVLTQISAILPVQRLAESSHHAKGPEVESESHFPKIQVGGRSSESTEDRSWLAHWTKAQFQCRPQREKAMVRAGINQHHTVDCSLISLNRADQERSGRGEQTVAEFMNQGNSSFPTSGPATKSSQSGTLSR